LARDIHVVGFARYLRGGRDVSDVNSALRAPLLERRRREFESGIDPDFVRVSKSPSGAIQFRDGIVKRSVEAGRDCPADANILDLARHIVNQKSGRFEPEKFKDQYETALIDLINKKRAGKPITPKERPRGENVVDLMEALRRSVGGDSAGSKASKKSAKKPRKASSGQKEMLMPIAGKKQAKEAAAKKPAAKPQRKSA
jgi:hypothetical protein